MPQFLIVRLQGVMQAWGKHTFEDYRASEVFPTRSAIEGLLGACLGVERDQQETMKKLSQSFSFAVRHDEYELHGKRLQTRKITDFHTVMDARKVDGSSNPHPVVSRREYLCDAKFTLAIQFKPECIWTHNQITQSLNKPVFTPFLGRKSCPITVPLFAQWIEAENVLAALSQVEPHKGVVYSEEKANSMGKLIVRDAPQYQGHRQFNKREVYIHASEAT